VASVRKEKEKGRRAKAGFLLSTIESFLDLVKDQAGVKTKQQMDTGVLSLLWSDKKDSEGSQPKRTGESNCEASGCCWTATACSSCKGSLITRADTDENAN